MKPYKLSKWFGITFGLCKEDAEFHFKLNTFHDCNDAVPWIRSMYPSMPSNVKKENSNLYPSGCYVYLKNLGFKDYGIYFNSDTTDKPAPYSRQVCLPGTLGNTFYMK